MTTSDTCSPDARTYVDLRHWAGRYALLWEAPDRIKRVLSRGAKNWPQYIDVDAGIEQLKRIVEGTSEGIEAVVLNDSHLLVYSVSSPWWAPGKRWLVEQFFVRIGKGSSDCAFKAIEDLADDWMASHIVMATAFARKDEALGKVYERHGYSQQSTQYVKEAQWLHSPLSSP